MLPLKKRPSLWLMPIFLIVALVYLSSYTDMDSVLGNSPAAVSGASTTLLFSCLLASIGSSLESSRERSSRGVLELSSRGYSARIFDRLWPTFLAASVIQIVIVVYLLVPSGQLFEPKLWLVVVGYLLAILAHSAFGYLLGQWLPGRFAVPLALVLSYLFLAFTGTSDYFPAHYLAGMTLNGCCMAAQSLDYRAVWTLIVFSSLISIGFLALAGNSNPLAKKKISGRASKGKYALGYSFIVFALVAGLSISTPLDGTPVVNDAAEDFTCTGHRPKVCLNEVQRFGGDRSELVAQSVRILSDLGFPEADRVTAERNDDAKVVQTGVLVTSFEPWYTDDQAVYAAASSYSAEVLNHLCDNDDYDKQYAAFEVLQDWSTAYALRSVLGIDTESSNQKLRSMSPRQQQDWALTTYEQLSRCEVPQLPKGSK